MTHYFTFTSDSSSKFWQIETHDTNLTVTFGKIGTAGQSQIKTFDSAERTQQEAAKLIREKTGKGYVEEVNGVAVGTPAQRTPSPRQANPDQEAINQLEARFDEIIERTQTSHLLPFLQGVDKRLYPALRAKIKTARKYWWAWLYYNVPTRHGSGQQAKYRGSDEQRKLVAITELVMLEKPDRRDSEVMNSINTLLADVIPDDLTWDSLLWAKPAWLGDYLLREAQRNSWTIMPYSRLRQLEKAQFVAYQTELFTLTVAQYRDYNYYSKGKQKHEEYVEWLSNDQLVASREIPTLFEYPTDIHNSTFSVEGKNPESSGRVLLWPIVFERLLSSGRLDRLWFLEQCISVQTKDWVPNLRQFFRKQVEAAAPTPAELLALQESLFPLLAAAHPHVVSWAVGLLKSIYTEAEFNVPSLLDWAGTLMSRDDSKTALKTMMGMLEKLLKTQPDHRPAITHLLADVFAINDMPLQTKAAALLATHADPTDLYLQDRLQTYAGQLLGNVPDQLKPFLAVETTVEPDLSGPATYLYSPPKPTLKLLLEQAVTLPQTWNDFLFLVGEFIATDDPLTIERLMNALLLPPADQPADFREQLRPYEKKLSEFTYQFSLKSYTMALVRHWTQASVEPIVFNELIREEDLRRSQLVALSERRALHIDRKRRAGSELPLLSLPTHAPHWIAPDVLIDRLVAYQRADESIEPLDLAIAIARMPRERTQQAIARCEELNKPIADLMRYCLGASTDMQLPSASALAMIKELVKPLPLGLTYEALHTLWAVAARTYQSDEVIQSLLQSLVAKCPNVVEPFAPLISIVEKSRKYKDWRTNSMATETWPELHLPFFEGNIRSPALLYSIDLEEQKKLRNWYHYDHHKYLTDIEVRYSLMPHYPEPLYAILVKYACARQESDGILTQPVRLMLAPGFQFRPMSLLVLACGLVNKRRETAALAAEVVIQHLGEQTLDVALLGDRLGWLLAGGYAPVQRLADGLNLMKDISPLHNKGLLLLLESLLGQFDTAAEVPRNTRKLLETYLDLLVKLGEKPAPAVSPLLGTWQATASLKKLCADLLAR